MTPWVWLSDPEFAFLAFHEQPEASILDDLGLPGAWARHPEVHARGEKAFAERIERTPEVDATGWATLVATVRTFGVPSRASALTLARGDDRVHLVTVPLGQALIAAGGVAVRLLEDALTASELAKELFEIVAPDAAFGVLRAAEGELQNLAWADGNLKSGEHSVQLDAARAMHVLSTFALDVRPEVDVAGAW